MRTARVISLCTVVEDVCLYDSDFAQLLSNAVTWSDTDATRALLLSTTDPAFDDAIVNALQGLGDDVGVTVPVADFDGTQDLTQYDAVILVPSVNWSGGDMPIDGQLLFKDFVTSGGTLVTGEWIGYMANYGYYAELVEAMPIGDYSGYVTDATTTYTVVDDDASIRGGVASEFSFTPDYVAGTESVFFAKPDATVFFNSSSGGAGVIGWGYGDGSVVSFSTVMGPNEMADINYRTLVHNALSWKPARTGDFDNDGLVGVLDLLALLGAWGECAGCPQDLDGDLIVGVLDLLMLFGEWG